ncbi:hypothetical protein ABW19_dt0209912 [Dactylella cylindrospora]|nr:hypothetical protein ABW19_dt0209912 [Dactylella cylindrospora]
MLTATDTIQPTSTHSPSTLDTSSLPSNPSSTTHSPMSAISSSVDSSTSVATSGCSCRNCGAVMPILSEADYPREAQLRIEELEQQVKEFSVRAVMADTVKDKSEKKTDIPPSAPTIPADNLAKSQKEVMELRRKSENSNSSAGSHIPSSPPRTNSMANTFQNFSRLCEERRQRESAEKQLAEVKNELEELSMSLFQQANEMVSTERKARAKLEERVALLEKRDAEKRARLDRLEKGMERINRVRNLLDKKT